MPKNPEKEAAILYFLNEYGILIDFEDESYLDYDKSVNIKPKDTFKEWKRKVFGNTEAQITVYGPFTPANNKLFKNIELEYSAEDIYELINNYKSKVRRKSKKQFEGKLQNERLTKKAVIEEAKGLVEKLPLEVLEACIDEEETIHKLEPSVKEFFNEWLKSNNEKINVTSMLEKLIHVYNASVKRYKQLQQK